MENRAPLPAEFELIRKYFAPLAAGATGAAGLADDVCTWQPPAGFDLVLTADALVENRHYLSSDPADLIARKMLRVNLSDLASKGAKPVGYLMTVALGPEIDESWIAAFCAGLAVDQKEFDWSLWGGDTVATPGPTTLSVTALGVVPAGRAMRRGAAKPGDRLYVTGTIGDGALGLKALRGELIGLPIAMLDALALRYRLPLPRVALGARLLALGAVHAAMDVSDGLVADAGHIAEASGCAVTIHADRVPLSPAAEEVLAQDLDLLPVILTGGDDYELLFTAPAAAASGLDGIALKTGVAITEIGEITTGSGVRVLDRDGAEIPLASRGWQHF